MTPTIKYTLGRLSLLPILAALFFGCVDEIDLTQGLPLPDGIVVSGRLLAGDDFTEAEVILEELFRFENSNRPAQIVTANVRVVNEDGQELTLVYRDGVYRGSIGNNDPAFRVAEGMRFNVLVTTREGASFASKPEVLLPKLEATSARAVASTVEVTNGAGNIENVPAMEYLITTPLRYPGGEAAYVRWLMDEYYAQTDESTDPNTGIKTCYIDLPFGGTEVKVVGNTAGDANTLTDFSLGKNRITFRYAEGNYMEIRQEAISQEAFEYYSQVNAIASRELSIFEAPGGPVVGNVTSVEGDISNVFGFFYVATPSIIRVPVTPAEAGNPVFACPLTAAMPPPITRCTDCLVASNTSTTVRPPWWEL
ncbi:MAG: DUF4249 family protein [Lewinella sp.]